MSSVLKSLLVIIILASIQINSSASETEQRSKQVFANRIERSGEPDIWTCPDNGDYTALPYSESDFGDGYYGVYGHGWFAAPYKTLNSNSKNMKGISKNMKGIMDAFVYSSKDFLLIPKKKYAYDEIKALASGIIQDIERIPAVSTYSDVGIAERQINMGQWSVQWSWEDKGENSKEIIVESRNPGNSSAPIMTFYDKNENKYHMSAYTIDVQVTCDAKPNQHGNYNNRAHNSMTMHRVELIVISKDKLFSRSVSEAINKKYSQIFRVVSINMLPFKKQVVKKEEPAL
jgi:hypothetical protein